MKTLPINVVPPGVIAVLRETARSVKCSECKEDSTVAKMAALHMHDDEPFTNLTEMAAGVRYGICVACAKAFIVVKNAGCPTVRKRGSTPPSMPEPPPPPVEGRRGRSASVIEIARLRREAAQEAEDQAQYEAFMARMAREEAAAKRTGARPWS